MAVGIKDELEKLTTLQGSDFVEQLKQIALRKEFHALDTDADIFIVGGEKDKDFPSLLNNARKAVEHGYRVYILPNPHDFRTADYIFERRGVYKLFDLKNISGKSIVGSRLVESIGQANRVLLNMPPGYSTRLLAADIKSYFSYNDEVLEVLIFKGKREIPIYRRFAQNPRFYAEFKKIYER